MLRREMGKSSNSAVVFCGGSSERHFGEGPYRYKRAGAVSEGEGFPLTTPAYSANLYAETLSPPVDPVAAVVDAAAVAEAASRLITICSLLFAPRLNVTC